MPLSKIQCLDIAFQNPVNQALIEILQDLDLPQAMLTAGCLFQAVWNVRSGKPADQNIRDYDVFYFDDSNLSWDAEDAVIQRVTRYCAHLGVQVEIRNQARVHLWYREKHGSDYPQLLSTRQGIDHFLVSCTCVGIAANGCDVYAPDGFEDLWNGVLRMNPRNAQVELFQQKCVSYQSRWPWLTIAH